MPDPIVTSEERNTLLTSIDDIVDDDGSEQDIVDIDVMICGVVIGQANDVEVMEEGEQYTDFDPTDAASRALGLFSVKTLYVDPFKGQVTMYFGEPEDQKEVTVDRRVLVAFLAQHAESE